MLIGFALVSHAGAQGTSETDNAPRSFAGERPRPVAIANGQPVVEPVRLPEPVESDQFLSPTGLTPTLKILLLMTVLALVLQLKTFFEQENYFLLGLDIVVLVAAILVALECAAALKRHRALAATEQPDAD